MHPTILSNWSYTPADEEPFSRSKNKTKLNGKIILSPEVIQDLMWRYKSYHWDPEGEAINTYTQIWTSDNNYVNPPFSQIEKVLMKIMEDKADCTLIAPIWPAQSWFNNLLQMCVDYPKMIPNWKDSSRTIRQHRANKQPNMGSIHIQGIWERSTEDWLSAAQTMRKCKPLNKVNDVIMSLYDIRKCN